MLVWGCALLFSFLFFYLYSLKVHFDLNKCELFTKRQNSLWSIKKFSSFFVNFKMFEKNLSYSFLQDILLSKHTIHPQNFYNFDIINVRTVFNTYSFKAID